MPTPKWKPGQSGNPKGQPPKDESLTFLMKQYLQQPAEGEDKKTNKQKFIEKAYAKAIKEGDGPTMKMIWQYIDGMPKQSIDMTSQGEKLGVMVYLPKKD